MAGGLNTTITPTLTLRPRGAKTAVAVLPVPDDGTGERIGAPTPLPISSKAEHVAERRERVKLFISHCAKNGYVPSLQEIVAMVGLKHKTQASRVVDAIRRQVKLGRAA